KGVADPFDEAVEAPPVLAHQIAGPKPGVAWLEDVAEDLLLGLGGVSVALEPVGLVARSGADTPDRLAGFALRTAAATAVGAAAGRARLGIEGDQGGREAVGHEAGDSPHGAGLAFEVEEGKVALGGGVELDDPGDGEALLESAPNGFAQAVAEGH